MMMERAAKHIRREKIDGVKREREKHSIFSCLVFCSVCAWERERETLTHFESFSIWKILTKDQLAVDANYITVQL